MPEPRLLAATCNLGNCPEIHRLDDNTCIVQGYDTETGEERRVTIPRTLLHEAVANDA